MNRFKLLGLAAMMSVVSAASAASEDTIRVANVIEMSGGGASNGVNWTEGLQLAVDEINAAGGLLGKKIDVTNYDTQTDASLSRAMVQKALDEKPLVVMGPIYSGSVKVNMILSQQAEVPQFVGAQAVEITRTGNPYVFRANLAQDIGMAKVADYMSKQMGVRKLAIVYVNNDFGKGGRNVLGTELEKHGIEVVLDMPIEYGQLDYATEVAKAKGSGADAVFAYMTAEDTARFLKEAEKQSIGLPLVGETTLLNQNVVDLAGSAVNGAKSHLTLTASAPLDTIKAFRLKFEERFKHSPDHNALSSYMALYAVKVAVEKNQELDPKALAATLHGLTVTTEQEPGILMDSRWDEKGDVFRASFLGEGVDGKVKIIETLP